MKILVLNNSTSKGGAAKAANRILESVMCVDNNIQCEIIADKMQKTKSYHKNVNHSASELFFRTAIDYFPRLLLTDTKKGRYSFWFIGKQLNDFIKNYKPDIIHLHWINEGFIAKDFFEFVNNWNIPIVVTMHDSWYFTGGCHITYDCEKYQNICKNCPQVKFDSIFNFAKRQFELKERLFTKNNFNFVAPSNWLKENAEKSTILKNSKIVNIPNPIDTNLFAAHEKAVAKVKLDLPINKRYILFGSSSFDENKGYSLFLKALENIKLSDDVEFLFFGSEFKHNVKFRYTNMGYIDNEERLSYVYAAADFTIVPSLQENLSNVIMESLASKTPVIAFNVGGNCDMIKNKFNGFLIEDISSDSLRRTIEEALQVGNKEFMDNNARQYVVENFDYKVIGQKYLNLYKEILGKNNG